MHFSGPVQESYRTFHQYESAKIPALFFLPGTHHNWVDDRSGTRLRSDGAVSCDSASKSISEVVSSDLLANSALGSVSSAFPLNSGFRGESSVSLPNRVVDEPDGRKGLGVGLFVLSPNRAFGSVSSASSAKSAWGSVSSESPSNIEPEALAVKLLG